MLHRGLALALAIAICAAACPLQAAGQAAPTQYFGVCASQPSLPTVYVSGVLQGTAASIPGLRAGFTQFLAQRYGYKGAVVCAPAVNAANAESILKTRTTALRNAKKNVVETGWAGSDAPAAALAGMLQKLPSAGPQSAAAAPAAMPATGGASAGSSSASGSSASSGSPELTRVLASIFGSGCAGGTAAKPQTPATSDASKPSDTGGSGCESALTQVSSALSSAFAQKSGAADSPSGPTAAQGLGSAQAQNTRLVVYGCGRRDRQIACVTELTNQNHADTLVQSADVWKDTFIVDDRGDRHARSGGFFLNIDGDQRTQLDISYGKSARLVLMFDDVQPRVQKVALRSPSGGLDVEEITLITTGTASDASP